MKELIIMLQKFRQKHISKSAKTSKEEKQKIENVEDENILKQMISSRAKVWSTKGWI